MAVNAAFFVGELTAGVIARSLGLIADSLDMAADASVYALSLVLEASWIFTANDIEVNLLVIVAGAVVAVTDSAVPELVAGGIIFMIIANGARRILAISRPDRPSRSEPSRVPVIGVPLAAAQGDAAGVRGLHADRR